MPQTLLAKNVTLRDLIDQYGLQWMHRDDFFPEWMTDLPSLSEAEEQALDKIKASVFNLLENPPFSEKAVQLTVVSPLLFTADFFLPPFHIKTEQSVEIQSNDEETLIRGQLDIVLIKNGLWALIIESKQADFSIEVGLAQLIAYLLANTTSAKPSYGLITTGVSFIFVKLVQPDQAAPSYATSDQFDIRRSSNELYDVLKILKNLAQIV
jgi:hypothetical protein